MLHNLKRIFIRWVYFINYKDIGTLYIIYGALAGIVGVLFLIHFWIERLGLRIQIFVWDYQYYNIIISLIMIFFINEFILNLFFFLEIFLYFIFFIKIYLKIINKFFDLLVIIFFKYKYIYIFLFFVYFFVLNYENIVYAEINELDDNKSKELDDSKLKELNFFEKKIKIGNFEISRGNLLIGSIVFVSSSLLLYFYIKLFFNNGINNDTSIEQNDLNLTKIEFSQAEKMLNVNKKFEELLKISINEWDAFNKLDIEEQNLLKNYKKVNQ